MPKGLKLQRDWGERIDLTLETGEIVSIWVQPNTHPDFQNRGCYVVIDAPKHIAITRDNAGSR